MPFDPDEFGEPLETWRVEALMSRLTDEDFERHEPPPSWDSLAERIRGDGRHTDDRTSLALLEPPPVTNLDARRQRPARAAGILLTAAAVIVVVVVAVGSALVVRSPERSEQLVASAELEQLEPLADTTASARLVTDGGTTSLVLDAEDMPPAPRGQSYELWLIDTEVSDRARSER